MLCDNYENQRCVCSRFVVPTANVFNGNYIYSTVLQFSSTDERLKVPPFKFRQRKYHLLFFHPPPPPNIQDQLLYVLIYRWFNYCNNKKGFNKCRYKMSFPSVSTSSLGLLRTTVPPRNGTNLAAGGQGDPFPVHVAWGQEVQPEHRPGCQSKTGRLHFSSVIYRYCI